MTSSKLVQLSAKKSDTNNEDLEYEKDIWDVRNLGNKVSPVDSRYTLNFTNISQTWLRQAAKQYARYSLATISCSGSINRLMAIKRFSNFLREVFPGIEPLEINRTCIVNYVSYLASTRLSDDQKYKSIVHLKLFFELCTREGWVDVAKSSLIYKEDLIVRRKAIPKYIPEEVLTQFNQHLSSLPEPIVRMVLILQETGLRSSELCSLKFNCIKQDTYGD